MAVWVAETDRETGRNWKKGKMVNFKKEEEDERRAEHDG